MKSGSAGFMDSRAATIAEEIVSVAGKAETGIVLGSGWGGVIEFLEDKKVIPYSRLSGMPQCGVEGHAGNFVFGKIGDKRVAAMQGRFHLYEGKSMADVVLPVAVLKCAGVQTLIITNSSGAINKHYSPGDVMLIEDHVNMTGQNPLTGITGTEERPVFIDLCRLYDPEMIETMKGLAKEKGIRVHTGVYAQVAGPSYETPSEIRLLRSAGADAVGMSTAIEAIYAKYLGLRVAAVSCVSNMGAGITHEPLDHEEVLETLSEKKAKLSAFLESIIRSL